MGLEGKGQGEVRTGKKSRFGASPSLLCRGGEDENETEDLRQVSAMQSSVLLPYVVGRNRRA